MDNIQQMQNSGDGNKIDTLIKNGEKLPNHSISETKRLNKNGTPNSSIDILNPDGTVKQRRYYDEFGRAKVDIDFNHTDNGTHTFPHRHNWDWTNPEKPKRLN